MQKAVEHGADSSNITKQFAPVFDGTIRCQQRAKTLVAAHDDFEQILGSRVWQLAHSKIVDDEQRNCGDRFHVLFTCAVGVGIGQFVEQNMGFAIQHFIPLQNGGLANGLGQMAFAGAGRVRNIMPMDPRSSRSTISFIRCLDRVCACGDG